MIIRYCSERASVYFKPSSYPSLSRMGIHFLAHFRIAVYNFPCLLFFIISFTALTDDGKFLLAARKCRRPTCTDYLISLDVDDMSKGSSTYIGKLRLVVAIIISVAFDF